MLISVIMKTQTRRKSTKAGTSQPVIAAGTSRENNGADGTPVNADGELICTTETNLTREQMLELYRYLKLTRLVEERLVNLYRQTKVVGGVFRSLGQEATAVGTAYALE